MNPELKAKLDNIRESLEWFEDSAANKQWHTALKIINDVALQVDFLEDLIEERSNQGN